jgi:hypothetical protein
MTVFPYVLAGIGLGLLAVVLAVGLVAAIVGLAGWLVRSLLGLGRLRQSLVARVSEQAQALHTFCNRLRNGKPDRMATA